jgi:hypothetical protein
MNPESQKKFNTVLGSGLLAAGILSWAVAFVFAVTKAEPVPAPVINNYVSFNDCRNNLMQLGYTVQSENQQLTAYEGFREDVSRQLDKATIAILGCGYDLASFCMGEGCQRPGINFTIKQPAGLREAPGGKKNPVTSAKN